MIPRSPTPLLVACVLASFAQSHAATIDDLMGYLQAPYLEDTVFGDGYSETLPRYEFEWTVGARDGKGRPLMAYYTEFPHPSPDSALHYAIDYTWDQPVDLPFRNWGMEYLPNCLGCTEWPSRIRTHLTLHSGTFVWDNILTWNASTRSMVLKLAGVGSTEITEGPCPWRDSLVFDAAFRPTLQVRCLESKKTDPAFALRKSMRLHYDNGTDTRPRWTSETSEDTSQTIDSAFYEGPAATPTRMLLSQRKAGPSNSASTTRIDSLLWDRDGILQARIIGSGATPAGKSRLVENYTWVADRLRTATTGIYPASTLWTPTIVLNSWSYGYGTSNTSVDRRTPRAHELRRTANGRIVISRGGSSPVHVEWSGLDGRRQNLAVIPEGESAISVAVPRGVGILRVTEDGRTKVHPIAAF